MACCGDVPTLETLAAVDILRRELPDLRVRVVNVVDLMRLQPDSEHPHGLSDRDFDTLFTADRPVIFAYHGYPWLIHRLTYRRTNHDNLHVRGYKEEGTTTTPFDMVMLNDLDRFHLVMDVIDRVPGPGLARRGAAPADGRRARALPRLHADEGDGPARGARLDLAARRGRLSARPRRQRRLEQPQALAARRARPTCSMRPSVPLAARAVDEAAAPRASSSGAGQVDAVGHRIVHGGSELRRAGR